MACFDQPNEFVEVVYDVPSRLPALLDSGEVDAILVSSIEYLRRDDLELVADVGIMSNGPVASVRMLSKVPLEEIQTLALDESSMTSNMLAQIILAERGVRPALVTMEPDQAAMLAACDACVLIGDKGLEADGTGLVDVDLGAAWTEMTGKPFVWAVWLARQDRFELDEWMVTKDGRTQWQLFETLSAGFDASGFGTLHAAIDFRARNEQKLLKHAAYRNTLRQTESESKRLEERRLFVVQAAVERSGWTTERVYDYLKQNVRYRIHLPEAYNRDIDCALKEFNRYLVNHGLLKGYRSNVRSCDHGRERRISRVHNLIPAALTFEEATAHDPTLPVEF